jgi:hypothetical protein
MSGGGVEILMRSSAGHKAAFIDQEEHVKEKNGILC